MTWAGFCLKDRSGCCVGTGQGRVGTRVEAVWRLRTLRGERDLDRELGRSRWVQGIRSDPMEELEGGGGG